MNTLTRSMGNVRVQVIVLSILFFAAYFVPLKSMVNIWLDNDDYSYGFLIPLASAYLLWEKRKHLSGVPVRSFWPVLPAVLFFLLLSLYGILGSSGNISMPSVPLLLVLITLFCFGVEALKLLIVPLGFLFFMVPVPAFIERHVSLHLKAVSTRLGGSFISMFDIPVHISGNVLDLGVTQLQVIDACSGLRYIFPLLALGVLYAYYFQRDLWRRLLCVFITIPIGVVINAVRIGVTGVLTDKVGRDVAEGFFHGFSGWLLFLVAFVILFLFGRLLSIVVPVRASGAARAHEEVRAHGEQSRRHGRTTAAFLVSASALSLIAALSFSTGALPAVKLDGGIQSFPLSFGQWTGRQETIDPEIIRASGAEEAFSGVFRDGTGGEVSLYIGYRSTAFLSNENFFHSPTVCIPSAGWVVEEETRKTIQGVERFGSLMVTRMVIERMGSRQIVYFWFQTKDMTTHDKNINRFHLSLHALRRDNTYDLFVRPIAPVAPTETIDSTERRMDGFVRDMMPVLLQFLKEKQLQA